MVSGLGADLPRPTPDGLHGRRIGPTGAVSHHEQRMWNALRARCADR